MLENSLRLAEELGLLDGSVEQVIDLTPMLGAAATQDTVRLVRHGVRKLIDAVAAADGDAAGRLGAGLAFDYGEPAVKPECRWREKAERERLLTRSRKTPSGRCKRSSRPTGCSHMSASERRTGCCAS